MRLEKRKRSSSTSAVIQTEPHGRSRPASTRSRRRSARSFDVLSFHRSCRATGRNGIYFEQLLPKSDAPVYRGKIVVLIDDRAISQSEHTCLFFEAASN